MEHESMTLGDVAALLGLHRTSVTKLAREGHITKVGHGKYDRESVKAYADSWGDAPKPPKTKAAKVARKHTIAAKANVLDDVRWYAYGARTGRIAPEDALQQICELVGDA